IATKVSCGWMNEKIPPRISRKARNAFNAFHQPLLTMATIESATAPAIRKTIPASTPRVFTEVMLNLNMIRARISQSVPVIRKNHQRWPKLSSTYASSSCTTVDISLLLVGNEPQDRFVQDETNVAV